MSCSRLDIFYKPKRLVYSNDDGVLILDETILQDISAINTPIVVVAMAGMYRTGKSYLMNRLAESNPGLGFPVGNCIEAETKGIWVQCTKHPKQANTTLLLLDTEGLGDVKQSDRNDSIKYFTLALLLCRVLCYNNIGVLNEDTIEKLAFSSALARNIFKNTHEKRFLNKPELIVCLRDFDLEMEWNGAIMTEDEYLENILQDKPDLNKTQRSRAEIRNLFVKRKCFSFERPSSSRSYIHNLELTAEESLPSGFSDDIKKFKSYVYTIKPGLLPNGTALNGPAFATLLNLFVKNIQTDSISYIPDTFQRWMSQENKKNVEHIIQEHCERLAARLPILDATEFHKACKTELETCLEEVRKKVSEEECAVFEKAARKLMEESLYKYKVDNDIKCRSHWENEINALYIQEVGLKDRYFCYDGIHQYMNNLSVFKAKWKRQSGKDEQRERVYNAFIAKIVSDKDEIQNEDSKIKKTEEEAYKTRLRDVQTKELGELIRNLECRLKEYMTKEEQIRNTRLMVERQQTELDNQKNKRLLHQHNGTMRKLKSQEDQLAIEIGKSRLEIRITHDEIRRRQSGRSGSYISNIIRFYEEEHI